MSDLSVPPLNLIAVDGEAPSAAPKRARYEPFAWPTPQLPCYPAPACAIAPEPCEFEGTNGKAVHGRMTLFNPEDHLVQLQLPPAKTTMPLRFDQFRRLALTTPLAAQKLADAAGLGECSAVPYRLRLAQGGEVEGQTIGHLETGYGLFLFEPLDDRGTVRRVFYPRPAYAAASIGRPLGETLVEQSLATPEQVNAALAEQQRLRSQKIGDILLERQIITREELIEAIDKQAKMPMVRIGEALIALGMISSAQLDDALAQQKADRSLPLGELLVRNGMVSRADLQVALARKMGYPLVDAQSFPVDVDVVTRLPIAVASKLPALPLMLRAGRLVVAVEDPTRKYVVNELEFASQCKVLPVLARAGTLAAAVLRAYELAGVSMPGATGAVPLEFETEEASKLLATLEQQQGAGEVDGGDDDKAIEQSDNSLVRLINSMILEAQAQGVSDIHVECQPGREKVKIRFRRDGLLRPYLELPHTHRNAVIARLKIMCDLDISERRKPQDGKISFGRYVPGQRLELRVATIPTYGGHEDAVLRLLTSAKPIPLDNLGLTPTNLRWVKEAMQRPYGMLLCVGPTGSGKTTTLHSALGYINVPERKIWTAEDPIEITQPGLRQVQVNPKIDWTFARALRAFLRADPDVIMVGEIRDKETAQIAIESSLTGHLVLSTLHTNSAAETVTRLIDMGMDPFNFSDSLLAVLAQRLVRRLCTECRAPYEASDAQIDELAADHLHAFGGFDRPPTREQVIDDWRQRRGQQGKLTLYKPIGCPQCDHDGFRGRAAIHELLPVSRALRGLIQTGANVEALQRAAFADGMRTLRQDGIEKVLAGLTTIEEVRANSN
jgi:type II secretory ATPase GspE/PulE/Tfp pilus assembly ATPase PilB-like protein